MSYLSNMSSTHKYKYVRFVKYVFKKSDMFGYVTVPLVSEPSRRYI